LCGACQAACPIKINIPQMLIGLRELQHHQKPTLVENLAYRLWKVMLKRPWLYRLALRVGQTAVRRLADDGWFRRLPGQGGNWTAVRDFPAPAPRAFRDMWPEL